MNDPNSQYCMCQATCRCQGSTTKDAHPKRDLLKMSLQWSRPAHNPPWLPLRGKFTLLPVAFHVLSSEAPVPLTSPVSFPALLLLSQTCFPLTLKRDKLCAASGSLHMQSPLCTVPFPLRSSQLPPGLTPSLRRGVSCDHNRWHTLICTVFCIMSVSPLPWTVRPGLSWSPQCGHHLS